MSEEHPTGNFSGQLMGAYLKKAYQSDDLDAIFEIATEHGLVKCKHELYDAPGRNKSTLERTEEVFMMFGLVFPDDAAEIPKLPEVWKDEISVYVGKTPNGYVYGKINSGGGKGAVTDEDIQRFIAKHKGEDPDNVPF